MAWATIIYHFQEPARVYSVGPSTVKLQVSERAYGSDSIKHLDVPIDRLFQWTLLPENSTIREPPKMIPNLRMNVETPGSQMVTLNS